MVHFDFLRQQPNDNSDVVPHHQEGDHMRGLDDGGGDGHGDTHHQGDHHVPGDHVLGLDEGECDGDGEYSPSG